MEYVKTVKSFDLLSEFTDGENRFQTSALLTSVVNLLNRGYSPLKIIDDLINQIETTKDDLKEVLENGRPHPILLNTSNALDLLIEQHTEFSIKTFGKNRDPKGPLKHLLKEVNEVIENPEDVTEFADCLLLTIDSIRLNGHTLNDVIVAAFNKLEINKKRE